MRWGWPVGRVRDSGPSRLRFLGAPRGRGNGLGAPLEILQAQGGRVRGSACTREEIPGISSGAAQTARKRGHTEGICSWEDLGDGAKRGGRLGSLPSPCSRKYHPPESTWAPTPALLEALRRVIPLNLHFLICKRGRIRPLTSPGAAEHAVRPLMPWHDNRCGIPRSRLFSSLSTPLGKTRSTS